MVAAAAEQPGHLPDLERVVRVEVADGKAAGAGLLSPTEYDALTKSAG